MGISKLFVGIICLVFLTMALYSFATGVTKSLHFNGSKDIISYDLHRFWNGEWCGSISMAPRIAIAVNSYQSSYVPILTTIIYGYNKCGSDGWLQAINFLNGVAQKSQTIAIVFVPINSGFVEGFKPLEQIQMLKNANYKIARSLATFGLLADTVMMYYVPPGINVDIEQIVRIY